jgi:hypothetical protein
LPSLSGVISLNSQTSLKQPPWQSNADGETRRVGIEIEIGGLELDSLTRSVADYLHLKVKDKGRYERILVGDATGEWVVEIDYKLLKDLGRDKRSDELFTDRLKQAGEDVLAWASESLVPLEIVSPPLPLDRLNEVEKLIEHLRSIGAKGSSDSSINAFGLHLNPELAKHDARYITASLKAFICLYEWLVDNAKIDFSRRVTSYIDPFPRDYIKKVLALDYWPDLATLIDDYLIDNPTRNRALDMLPLFKFLDEDRVTSKLDEELIKARPTFHYRLPNSEVDKKNWGLYVAWNDWLEVEYMAANEAKLNSCCQAYLDFLNSPTKTLFNKWSEQVQKIWLSQ